MHDSVAEAQQQRRYCAVRYLDASCFQAVHRKTKLAKQSLNSKRMSESKGSNQRSIFERLEARGIGPDEYGHIKTIVSFDLPQSMVFFERQFPHRTPAQVLRQVEKWRGLLERDFILADRIQKQIEHDVLGAELFAWKAIVEAAFSRQQGEWRLSKRFIRTSETADVGLINPDTEVTAVNSKTKEKRVAVIPLRRGDASWGASWKAGFRELGILDIVLDPSGLKPLVTSASRARLACIHAIRDPAALRVPPSLLSEERPYLVGERNNPEARGLLSQRTSPRHARYSQSGTSIRFQLHHHRAHESGGSALSAEGKRKGTNSPKITSNCKNSTSFVPDLFRP